MNGKWGYINQEGEEIITPQYNIANNFHDRLALVYSNRQYKYINQHGEEIIMTHKYDFATDFHDGLACVSLNGKCGYINKNGEEVIPLKYDSAADFHDGLARVSLNGKSIYVDKNGKETLLSRYHLTDDFHEDFARVTFNKKYGFINQHGEEVILCRYDNATNFHNGYAIVKIGEKSNLIDKNGISILSNLDNIEYLGENIYMIEGYYKIENGSNRVIIASLDEILSTIQETWEKISENSLNIKDIEKLKEISKKISKSHDIKKYFDLIIDGEVFSFDTLEEREEYEQKLIQENKNPTNEKCFKKVFNPNEYDIIN